MPLLALFPLFLLCICAVFTLLLVATLYPTIALHSTRIGHLRVSLHSLLFVAISYHPIVRLYHCLLRVELACCYPTPTRRACFMDDSA
ncbi:hypothetical protein BDN72DRAFT_844797 [Pluteus cervinus]|uniref:Uncharacterized protein n=1 Tax=Pluteus cervinus TaxID=181527 RepID=A0ACD3AKT9_9AGAR|nr:hypothetical protein BDN72DRAFT_844797 [Pluteus cervinus]